MKKLERAGENADSERDLLVQLECVYAKVKGGDEKWRGLNYAQ